MKSITTLSVQVEVMFELLQSAVFEREPFISPMVRTDWDFLMDLSSSQGILAWVYDGICKLPIDQQPSRQQHISWALSAQEIWDGYAKKKEVLEDMVKICEENGMRLLLLKGIGLSELYPKPESRPSGDIDVYFFGDYERGNFLFCDGTMKEGAKHSEFLYKGVNIENHRTFLNISSPKMKGINDYLLDSIEPLDTSNVSFCTFSPLGNLLFLVVHAANHLRYNEKAALSIRSIVDISFFINKYSQQLSPQLCKELMNSFNMTLPFELLVRLGEWILGINLVEYYNKTITDRDMNRAKEYIIEGTWKYKDGKGNTVLWRFINAYRGIRQRKWRYKYLPDPAIRWSESRTFWLVCIKYLFFYHTKREVINNSSK